MKQSDTAFAVTLAVGFIWGWLMKALNEWGKREDARKEREAEARAWARRHPSWSDYDN